MGNARAGGYPNPPLVPSSWYTKVEPWQRVVSPTQSYAPHERPVLLRGCYYAQLHKYGSARLYGTYVLARYIRWRRMTEVDPVRWQQWVRRELLSKCKCRRWFPSQQASMDDIRSFVSDYSVVIDGRRHLINSARHLLLVKRLHTAFDRMVRQERAIAREIRLSSKGR